MVTHNPVPIIGSKLVSCTCYSDAAFVFVLCFFIVFGHIKKGCQPPNSLYIYCIYILYIYTVVHFLNIMQPNPHHKWPQMVSWPSFVDCLLRFLSGPCKRRNMVTHTHPCGPPTTPNYVHAWVMKPRIPLSIIRAFALRLHNVTISCHNSLTSLPPGS